MAFAADCSPWSKFSAIKNAELVRCEIQNSPHGKQKWSRHHELTFPERNNCIYELFIHSPKGKICRGFIEIPQGFRNWIILENSAFQKLPLVKTLHVRLSKYTTPHGKPRCIIIALGPYIWGSSAISKTAPFLKSLVLQILFLWKQLYKFNLPIAILKALSTALYLVFNWLEVIFCYLVMFCLYTRGLISRVYLSPIIIWPLFWHDEPGATRGWWSLSKRSKVPRDLQFSAFLTVKFHVWILSLPRVFFPRRVKSWMKNMIASFWELDLRWALQHLSKKSVAVASGGFRKARIVDRVSHPIWNFLRSRKTSWFHVNLKLLDRRISFENLHLGSKDKLVYKPILKYFKSWNSGVLRGISCISFYKYILNIYKLKLSS